MPNQPKTAATSYRLTPDELSTLDALRDHFHARSGLPRKPGRTDILRVALQRLAEAELGLGKKFQKK